MSTASPEALIQEWAETTKRIYFAKRVRGRWEVWGQTRGGREYNIHLGRFWRWITAARVAQAMNVAFADAVYLTRQEPRT